MTTEQIIALARKTENMLLEKGRPAVPCVLTVRIGTDSPLARYFDHTLLKQDATSAQFAAHCRDATRMKTRSVCVPPNRVALCVSLLEGTEVEVCTVVGFPLGYDSTSAKVAEVEIARSLGATEFDMVIPVGRLRDRDIAGVYDDVRAVVVAADSLVVKVILETALLTDEEKVIGSVAALHGGAAFIKTSTGFSTGGATVEDLRLMRTVAGDSRGVNAAGGMRDLTFVQACIEAGADRIGASATGAILSLADAGSAQGGGGY